jgi:hypothetical protein
MGAEESRCHLLLSQDPGDLRATGSFLAAFVYLEAANGHIEIAPSEDIYDLPRYACSDNAVPGEARCLAEGAGEAAATFGVFVSRVWAGGLPVQDSD